MPWHCLGFDSLSPLQLYALLALRSAVFVVEQQCLFQDLDGLDPQALHLLGTDDAGTLMAYARLLPPGLKQSEPVIGRVVTAPTVRGQGRGRDLMRQALQEVQRHWPSRGVGLHAQAQLEAFYAGFGFQAVAAPYIEDGIPHIEMRLVAPETLT